jgi:hypothetical protein
VSDNSVDNPPSSRDTVKVIQQTAHTRSAANGSAAIGSPERLNQFVADALMVPLTVVVRDELRNRAAKRWRSPNGITPLRHSSLIDRTKRSAYALQFGARNGV